MSKQYEQRAVELNTQQRAVEVAREHGASVDPWWCVSATPGQLHAICEQYHREAREAELNAWKQWWRGVASAQPEKTGEPLLIQALHAIHTNREAIAARCPDCGETNPAQIHTCSPQKPASVEPVGFQAREIGDGDWFNVRLDEIERINAYKTSAQFDYRFLYTATPDAEALRKRVAELEADVERLNKLIDKRGGSYVLEA